MSVDLKLLVVSEDSAEVTDINSRVGKLFAETIHIQPHEVRREISRLQPDLVILHEQQDDTVLQLLPYIKKEVSDALIVYLMEREDHIRARDVSRAGAFDILFLPGEINALPDVLGRAVKVHQAPDPEKEAAASFTWGRGQVVAFYGAKGGCGRSLITGTLAQTIGLDSKASVLLVDLNLQYGGVETYLNVENERNLYDLTPVLDELNDNHIRSVTAVEPLSQIELLVSPTDAEIAEQITEKHVERLLRTARLYYDYILVDLPTEMTSLVYTALEEADRLIYVMTADSPSIRVLSRTIELFEKIGVDTTGRFDLLINRITKDTELRAKDIKQHFPAFSVVGELREDDKRIFPAINRGKPLRTAPKERRLSTFAKDLQKVAQWLLAQQRQQSAS